MLKILFKITRGIVIGWVGATILAGLFLLPPILLHAPLPTRSEAERATIRRTLCPADSHWTCASVNGGEGVPLEVWRLHRPVSKGVAVILHGFGDDAWGAAPRASDLPDWDAVVFTFRGRDQNPKTPSTLGGWERADVVAVVEDLIAHGTPRNRILIVGTSQGAGVALLALMDLERTGGPLAGALLESPYRDLMDAGRNHIAGTLGSFEILARPAEAIALWRAGRLAHFKPSEVSPEMASRNLRTPIALLTGDQDSTTPLVGVQAIARFHPDLVIVPGAGHCEAGGRIPGGWGTWAELRLNAWECRTSKP